MLLEYEIQRKTHMHVWKHKRLKSSLVSPLRLDHVLHDDRIFLIMGIVGCQQKLEHIVGGTMSVGQTQLNDIL